jgi:phosphatidylinositol glycan class V
MASNFLPAQAIDHPIRSLTVLFLLWKALLLLIACSSPGLGYDTSTSLLLSSKEDNSLPWIFRYVVSKLARWDAIYFIKVSNRGYIFEQEWAFGWGFTRLINISSSGKITKLPCDTIITNAQCRSPKSWFLRL